MLLANCDDLLGKSRSAAAQLKYIAESKPALFLVAP